MRQALFLITSMLLLSACPAPPLVPGTLPSPSEALGEHWLRFAHISDTQLADEESPARAVRTDALISASWRPQEAYGVATLDATLRVINARHAAGKALGLPVDFTVVTGDLCDLAESNELRWFIDTMDGKLVRTDTGAADGAGRTAEDADNPKLPYQAEGLSPEIPWYTVIGNHDALAVGNFPVDTRSNSPALYSAPLLGPVAALIGLHDIDRKLNAFYPVAGLSPAVITGQGPLVDVATEQIDRGALHAGKIAPDNGRHFLSREEFESEHFNTTTQPPGHGFGAVANPRGYAFYTFRPKAEVPVRFIAFDTVPLHAPGGFPAFYGVLPREEFEQDLKPAIAAAKAAGEFVILCSHHPSEDFSLPYPARKVDAQEFRAYLSAQPNVIAHLCGHTHVNRIHRVEGKFPYFEIETGAIIDYPQEGRMFDVYFNAATGVATLTAEMFGHMESPTRLSAESYRRSVIDAQQGQGYETPPAKAAYQALFSARPKAWGIGGEMPQEARRPTPEKRAGGAADRDVIMTLPRPLPGAWK